MRYPPIAEPLAFIGCLGTELETGSEQRASGSANRCKRVVRNTDVAERTANAANCLPNKV